MTAPRVSGAFPGRHLLPAGIVLLGVGTGLWLLFRSPAVAPAGGGGFIAASATQPVARVGSSSPPGQPDTSPATLGEWIASIDTDAIPETLEEMLTIADGNLRTEARAALLRDWVRRDPHGALRWFAVRGGADRLHEQARDIFAEQLAAGSPADAFAWMERNLPPAARQEIAGAFYRAWAGNSPASAAGQLQAMISAAPGGDQTARLDLLGQVVARWAGSDIRTAVAWTTALNDGLVKMRALEQIAYRWTEVDPVSASMHVSSTNNPSLLATVAGKWAETDPQAAARWVGGLPDGHAKGRALDALLSGWAQSAPAAAADYSRHLAAPELRHRAILTVMSTWSEQAPAEAAAWAALLPPGPSRSAALALGAGPASSPEG